MRPNDVDYFADAYLFQSTHPMRDATKQQKCLELMIQDFNPRIPCGMRHLRWTPELLAEVISIHASHAGCDSSIYFTRLINAISIHASHAGCDSSIYFTRLINAISIHASHAGCDANKPKDVPRDVISIHASHAGCDIKQLRKKVEQEDFNPRIPCGMRRCANARICVGEYFNPRIPCGMRRTIASPPLTSKVISIHASHAGCDPMVMW